MSNIEEDIMSEEAFNELIDNFEIVNTLTEYGRKAIKQNVKKLQKRIKELEEKNKLLLSSKVGIDLSYDDYIPKQKVKDNFNKLITRIKEFKDPERKKYFSIEQIIYLLEQFENKLLEDK